MKELESLMKVVADRPTGSLPRRALKVPEAARALSVGKNKIYDWINDGRLRSVKIDGTRLIPVEAIDELLRG